MFSILECFDFYLNYKMMNDIVTVQQQEIYNKLLSTNIPYWFRLSDIWLNTVFECWL